MKKNKRTSKVQNRFKGVMPPVPTLFIEDMVSTDRFRANLQRLVETGLSGFVVLGSNGEANLLTEVEKLRLVRAARAEIPQEKIMIVGTGLETTQATCEFTKKVADRGADAALVLTPSFYRPGNEELRRHYETVADAAPIPILLYNVPKYTGMNMPVELAAKLAKHRNIIGIKDSAGDIDQLIDLREKTPPGFRLFIGSDKALFIGLTYGCDGAILALANIAPHECVALYEATVKQDWQLAQKLAMVLAPVGRTVVGKYGVAGLKAALDILGYNGGDLRLPLMALGEEERREIRKVLEKLSWERVKYDTVPQSAKGTV